MTPEQAQTYYVDGMMEKFKEGQDKRKREAMKAAASVLNGEAPHLDDVAQALHDSDLSFLLGLGGRDVENKNLIDQQVKDSSLYIAPRIQGDVVVLDSLADAWSQKVLRIMNSFLGDNSPFLLNVDRSNLTDEGTERTALDPALKAWSVF